MLLYIIVFFPVVIEFCVFSYQLFYIIFFILLFSGKVPFVCKLDINGQQMVFFLNPRLELRVHLFGFLIPYSIIR
jgi:hypothetical protein